jgi:hypothetical protein
VRLATPAPIDCFVSHYPELNKIFLFTVASATEMLTPLDKPIDSLADLSHGEKTSMREWEGHFSAKYPVVGELVEEGEL